LWFVYAVARQRAARRGPDRENYMADEKDTEKKVEAVETAKPAVEEKK
jgi:hypothetical protein